MRTRPASKAQAEDATTSDAVFYVITSTKVLRLVCRGFDDDLPVSEAGFKFLAFYSTFR